MKTTLLPILTLLTLPLMAESVIPQEFSDRAKELLADSTELSAPEHCVNVIYFVPQDIEPYADYQRRLSELLLYLQQFYGKEMARHGYAGRSFGLKRLPNGMVDILLIRGREKQAVYADYEHEGWLKEAKEVEEYFKQHPEQRSSCHNFFLSPVPAGTPIETGNPGGWAFHGDGTNCYAIDYPDFELKHLGCDNREGKLLTLWYGGFAHELGHGLNLPHNDGTASETDERGTALLGAGNYTFGSKPTFMTQASCDILDKSEVFAPAGDKTDFYRDHGFAEAQGIRLSFDGEALTVQAKVFGVAHVNVYVQDPPYEINKDYDNVAFTAELGAKEEDYSPVSARIPVAELRKLRNTQQGEQAIDLLFVREDGSRARQRFVFDWAEVQPNKPLPIRETWMLEGY